MLGTLLAFAVAELAIGYLNSSTAFLGSIILGNGINYGIVLGARYRERAAAGASARRRRWRRRWRGSGTARWPPPWPRPPPTPR